ncbi:Uncharacterised protein [Legionella spiritensis]|nr:Uncharacterised protein [Legionella spiritensis]
MFREQNVLRLQIQVNCLNFRCETPDEDTP